MGKNIFKDKRIIVLYIIVGIGLLLGITYALDNNSIAMNVNTAYIRVDESAYGDTTFDTSNINFTPILDGDLTTSLDKVIKIDFTVGGNQNNNADNIIYDIALNDLNVHCNLLSPYIKWKLIKNGTEISNGSLDYRFDTITNGRLVLTNTQQDLAPYNASKTGYDNYTFYMWFSDSCQSDLTTCVTNGQVANQSDLLGKMLSGKVEVELYNKSKKTLVRNPRTTIDSSTCTTSDAIYLNTKAQGSYVTYTGNNGCSGKACEGQNANYVSSSNMGWCGDSSLKFNTTGWRIAYIDNGNVYLISAGAPECMCTGADESYASAVSGCSYYSEEYMNERMQNHLDNLNAVALKYCNGSYVDGGVCDITTVQSFGAIDSGVGFNNVSNSDFETCVNDSTTCISDLINIGGAYWSGVFQSRVEAYAYSVVGNDFLKDERYIMSRGVRPIIKLASTIKVTGGKGTMDNPYQISN